jgi:hypothetical protein
VTPEIVHCAGKVDTVWGGLGSGAYMRLEERVIHFDLHWSVCLEMQNLELTRSAVTLHTN